MLQVRALSSVAARAPPSPASLASSLLGMDGSLCAAEEEKAQPGPSRPAQSGGEGRGSRDPLL